jgi:molybdate transport system permease protein
MPLDWSPLWLSLRYAGLATLFAILMALPLACLLARRNFTGSDLLDAAANLPLLLPPAVTVYYLLAKLGRWPLEFNWHTAVAVSAIYTMPLVLRMTRAGLRALHPSFANAARVLDAGEWRIFWRVTVPLTWRALLAAVLAGFVRAFADFSAAAIIASRDETGWLLLPAGALALAGLYVGNRVVRQGQELA